MNARARRLRASPGALAVALILAAGCGEADPCASRVCAQSACIPPFFLAVTDESTGEPLPDAQATSPGLTCTAPFTGAVACAAGTAQATHAVEVSAPGHRAKQVQVVVGPLPPPGECGCQTTCQAWQPGTVTLVLAAP